MQFKYIESHLFHATAVVLLIPKIYAYLNCNLCNIFHKQNLNLKISVLKKKREKFPYQNHLFNLFHKGIHTQ